MSHSSNIPFKTNVKINNLAGQFWDGSVQISHNLIWLKKFVYYSINSVDFFYFPFTCKFSFYLN